MLLMKVVLLIWYSNNDFGFMKIVSYLASKIDFEIWKCPIFASSASNCLTRYEQILSGCSLGCKNALNFTCLTMKFHNHVHTTWHRSRTSASAGVCRTGCWGWYVTQVSVRIIFGRYAGAGSWSHQHRRRRRTGSTSTGSPWGIDQWSRQVT